MDGRMSTPAKHTPGIPDKWLHSGEWALCGNLYVYPRDGKFHIGRPSGARDFRDVESGFENIGVAIDHAHWMNDEALATPVLEREG